MKENHKNLLHKTVYITILLASFSMICTSAFFVGRTTATTAAETETAERTEDPAIENVSLNLETKMGWQLADNFVGEIVDWNACGNELYLMTTNGYEFCANKVLEIYP